jgi:multidrug efflux system membrane fusion protein
MKSEIEIMSKNRGIVLLLLLLAASVLASCGGERREAAASRGDAPSVVVEAVTIAPVAESYEAVGTVRARTSSVLSSKVMGQVLSVRAQQGQYVRQGELLVEIDSRDAAANLAKARAGLSEAKNTLIEVEESTRAAEAGKRAAEAADALAASTYKRYQTLLERDSVSRQEFDEVDFRHKAAQAEVVRASQSVLSAQSRRNQALDRIEQADAEVRGVEVYMSYTRVTAPYSGLITAKQVEPGALAAPGAPLLTIEDNRNYRLEATVEESQINKIHIGDQAPVVIDALAGRELIGSVEEIVPVTDPSSRSFLVKLKLPQIDGLRSGTFGRASFASGQKELLSVASKAVFQRGQLVGVMVVGESNTARLRLIKTGKRYADRIEVLSGLTPGERVISEAPEQIQDGATVTFADVTAVRRSGKRVN